MKKMFSMFRYTFSFSAAGSACSTASFARLSHTSFGTGSWSVRHGMWTAPGTTSRFSVPRSRGRLGDLAGQFQPAGALRRVVARQRVRPEQERAQPADRDADLLGRAGGSRRTPSARTSARGRFRGRSSVRCRRTRRPWRACRHCSSVIFSGYGNAHRLIDFLNGYFFRGPPALRLCGECGRAERGGRGGEEFAAVGGTGRTWGTSGKGRGSRHHPRYRPRCNVLRHRLSRAATCPLV